MASIYVGERGEQGKEDGRREEVDSTDVALQIESVERGLRGTLTSADREYQNQQLTAI